MYGDWNGRNSSRGKDGQDHDKSTRRPLEEIQHKDHWQIWWTQEDRHIRSSCRCLRQLTPKDDWRGIRRLVEESSKAESESSIEKAIERFPQLKELRSHIDARLESVRKEYDNDKKEADEQIAAWNLFEAQKTATTAPSQIDAIWIQIAKLAKAQLASQKNVMELQFRDFSDYFEMLFTMGAGLSILAEGLDKTQGSKITKEEAQALVEQQTQVFGTNLLRRLIERENRARRRWIKDKFGGAAPKWLKKKSA